MPASTYYVRDQNGVILATYTDDQTQVVQSEIHIQGASTVGIIRPYIRVEGQMMTDDLEDYRANREYQLTNHLGNVITTITDRRLGIDVDADHLANHYVSEIIQAQDYYPFGMKMSDASPITPMNEYSGRTYQHSLFQSNSYRFAYNGKEMDASMHEELEQLDYGFRVYNPGLGRFLSVDPLADQFPGWNPYHYVHNNPIRLIDPTGMSAEDYDWIYDQQDDGSYKRREGVENDGGENFHTFINNDGTVTYVNTKEGTCATVCMDDVNQKVEDLNTPVVHQIGLSAAGGAPLGLTISGGIAWDSEGNVNPYGSVGFFHGLDITAGVEYTQSRSNSNDKNFSIYSLDGTSFNYNAGAYIFDAAYGGDTQGNGNYGQNEQSTYSSYTGGVSVGIPVGLNRSVESTKVFKLFGQ